MSKLTLPIAELKPALTGLGKIIAKRTTLPVLSHLKIERTKDGWIALTATDLDSFITVRLEQPSEGEAITLLVPFDELQKITKICQKNDTILVTTDEKASEPSVTIQYAVGSQVAETKVATLPPAEFPEIPRIKGEPVTINDDLRRSIHQALDCASTDETRLVLNSAYIDVSQKEGHYVVGINGSHLFASNSFRLPLKDSVIIPAHKFIEWKEFNSDGEWVLKIAPPLTKGDQGHLQLSSRRWRFIMRQIEGTYPNWRQVTHPNSDYTAGFQLAEDQLDGLAETIERLPDHDAANHTIGIELKDQAVNLLWKPDKEQPWKPLAITTQVISGKGLTIYLNREFVTKALRFGLNRLDFIDPMSPMRFSSEGRQMILMPVRAEAPVSCPTAAPQAQETAPEATPEEQPAVPSAAANEERKEPMVNNATNGTDTNTTAPVTIDAQFDQLLEEVETMKVTVQDHLTGLKTLGAKLKGIQREHKSSSKGMQTIRQTLKDLQSVKL